MKVIVIGAHGGVGKLVTQKLQDHDNFTPTALIRKQEQTDFFAQMGTPCVIASIENSVEEIAKAISGFDAIVFTAGSGGNTGDDKTLTVDLDGAVKVMKAAQHENVKRMVMLSAAFADDRTKWEVSGLKPYYVAKHFADQALRDSKLNYTILRPVGLTDEDETGKIAVHGQDEFNYTVPRADVAQTIVEALEHQISIGQIYEFSSGNTPIRKLFS